MTAAIVSFIIPILRMCKKYNIFQKKCNRYLAIKPNFNLIRKLY